MNQQEHLLPEAQASLVPSATWRTEPEIERDRQRFLVQRLAVTPDISQGVYPFKDVQLTRADLEWLLVAHEQERGPVEWSDPSQRERMGLDLRGANLRYVNLSNVPLARLRGGLTQPEWVAATLEQRAQAGVHLEHADLGGAHLEGAILRGAFLQNASLRLTHLEQAILFQAHLEQAYLRRAYLQGASMMYAHLEGTYLRKALLTGADLRHAICDNATTLEKVVLYDKQWGCVQLADIHWSDCNLALIDWRRMAPLGDEALARASSLHDVQKKPFKEKQRHLDTYQAAVRANRQLANAMRAQGMNEEAIPFAYRAQTLQRAILWRHLLWGTDISFEEQTIHTGIRRWGHAVSDRIRTGAAYLFSWFLDILAGYGYKPERSVGIYLLTVLIFTCIYLVAGALPFRDALVFSITAFHGRGFLPGAFTLDSPVTALAAFEAVLGLFIEISFIATFTQRFFGR